MLSNRVFRTQFSQRIDRHEQLPTVRVTPPAQIRVIADNKLAENAVWDRELLGFELNELSIELNFDVTVTGFETAEVDL